ncbi:MAG: hypothetical protein AAGC66_00260 [Leifsonia sp.]
MSFFDSPVAVLVGAVWVAVLATVAVLFRGRIAGYVLRLASPQEDEAAQRRDATVGVVLVAVFGYVLAAMVMTMSLLPSGDKVWPLAVGLPAAAVLALLYSVRFSNAGLSVMNWLRR